MMTIKDRLLPRSTGHLNPEAAVTSTALFLIANILPVFQLGIGMYVNERLNNIPPEQVVPYAIGMLGLSTLLNMAIEAKTLREKGYSANPISTACYIKSKKAVTSTIIGSIPGILNIADIGSGVLTLNSLINEESMNNMISSNLIAKSLISAVYWSGLNILLMQNKLGFVTDKVDPVYQKIMTRVKKKFGK